MTDFAKPTTPGEALRSAAKSLDWFAGEHDHKAREHREIAQVLRERAGEMRGDADSYDQYQPTPHNHTYQEQP